MKTTISRRRFAGIIAAVTSATAAAPKAKDVITQADIRRFVDEEFAVMRTNYEIRRRLFAGATVEAGPLSLELEDVMELEDTPDPRDLGGFNLGGLDVHIRRPETLGEAIASGAAAHEAAATS